MKFISTFDDLKDHNEIFRGVDEDVVMNASAQTSGDEEGKQAKRISDHLAQKGIVLTRADCLPEPELPSGLDDDSRSEAISLHYAFIKIWFLICWLNKVDSSDLASELEVKASRATKAKHINDAIQDLCNEYPFVSAHLSVITAMRVRALSLNPFQEQIGMTPEFNQKHVDFKIISAPALYLFNSLKDKAIKDGSYSKKFGKELLQSYQKRICYNWNFISALYDIRITDFSLFEMALIMRLSGYTGSVRPAKASKKQLKEVVFPTIMTYLLDFLVNDNEVWTKPFVTKGAARNSQIISSKELSDMPIDEVNKLFLHDFLTGPNLVKKIIAKINNSGFVQHDEEA